MNVGTTIGARPGTGSTRSFTRLELLVVAVVILLLASLAIALSVSLRGPDKATRCLAQLHQVGFGYLRYLSDYDSWMPCGGNKETEMFDRTLSGERGYHPTYEFPWFRPAWAETPGFPYWYEALQPYLDASATATAARKSYKDRTGKDIGPINPADVQPAMRHWTGTGVDPANPQPALRVEQARLMGILACPAKPDAPVGYGYHYTAPFGNTYCYPNNRDTFRWYLSAADQRNNTNAYDHPVQYDGKTVPIPILWYAQYLHSSILTKRSDQVILCDTGLSTPETRDLRDSRLWRETPDNNDEGYVRFPLMKGYWPPDNKVPFYRLKPWRPVPRHGGKTACLFFDGGARPIPIEKLCSPDIQWGDPGCLFDNKPPNRPPISPLRGHIDVAPPGGHF